MKGHNNDSNSISNLVRAEIVIVGADVISTRRRNDHRS